MLRRLPGLCLAALLTAACVARLGAAKPPDLPDNPPIIVAPQQCPAMTTTVLYNVHPITALLPQATPPLPCPCPHQPGPMTEAQLSRTVMENLEALEKAAELLAQAKALAREGRYSEALDCLEKGKALVPGSAFERRANEVLAEMHGHLAFDTFRSAFAEAVRDYWGACGIHPGCGLCWFSQARALIEQKCQQQAQHGGDAEECHAAPANGCPGCPGSRTCPHACPVEVKLCLPVSGRWTSVPLGAVLADLDRTHGVTVVVEEGSCLDQSVSLDVEGKPLAAVFQMLGQPFGLEPKVQGGCVYLTRASAAAGEECCDEAPGVKVCPAAACCPKCEKMHIKVVKKKRQAKTVKAGVEEQVNGLMKACYLAIGEGRYGKATDLARQAHALDARRVEGDPIIYKFGLLAEKADPKCGSECCCAASKPCCADCPCHARTAKTGSITIRVGVNSNAGACCSVGVKQGCCDVGKCTRAAGQACASCKDCCKSCCKDCCKSCCKDCCKSCCKAACAAGTCSLGEVSCCGVKMACACRAACELLKTMYLSPLVTSDDGKGNGCLTFGLSTSGQVNAFCRARHEGVVYHVLFKDGVFLMWMTPEAKSK